MPLFNIGFVIFPDLTQLDFTGPLQVLSRLPQSATHIVPTLTTVARELSAPRFDLRAPGETWEWSTRSAIAKP